MSNALTQNLSHLLADYQPFDDAEDAHLRQLQDFIVSSGDNLFTRVNLAGHITASALVVDGAGTKTLLTHHAKLNRWLQFGGHIDADDMSISAAALREAIEESGLPDLQLANPAVFDIDVHSIPENAKKDEPGHLHFDIRFLVIAQTDDFTISDESNDLRWCTYKEALNLLNYDTGLTRMLKKWSLYN